MTDSSSRIYITKVMHQRNFPVKYRFSYPVFSLLLNLDTLEQDCKPLHLLSIDRFNLLSFNRADHGARDGTCLKTWAAGLLREENIDLQGGTIQLLCFPRLLGYGFNPISIWYCHHQDGRLRAVICEVNNTFNEHHFYLIHENGKPLSWPVKAVKSKRLHVSPLIGMKAEYHFRFSRPGQKLGVVINEFQDNKLMLTASQSGVSHSLVDRSLLAALMRTPLMTFKVMAAIHWQALKIWLRGAPFFQKPQPPKEQISS
ncbi:MAG: DUF1365 domain-containing protein [Candidatus Thiodiazotropha sp. 6PDIVS]